MNAAGRLTLFGAGVVAAFAAAFAVSATVVPDEVAASWNEGETMKDHSAMGTGSESATPRGLAVSSGGYLLSPVAAPATVGTADDLRFRILDGSGQPVTDFAESHGRDLHLIVVRSDGDRFRHVHPVLDPDSGIWSLPWQWDAAGTYRVYADFVPGDGADGVTLTRSVSVAGDYSPVQSEPARVSETDGFTASIEGDLTAGAASELTISIERGSEPVTGLEPYLGAFGHLVALREGDLAFLHVHPHGDEPEADETSGPEISFTAEVPTAGRYLLYLDFQVDGQVHTAEFVLDAGTGAANSPDHDEDEGAHGH